MTVTHTQLEVCCQNLDICNPSIDDHDVAIRIRRACPPTTYSWMLVRTTEHHFETSPGGAVERSRLIQFQPTNRQAAWNILCTIFQTTTNPTLNINRVVLGLLGSKDQRDIQAAQSAQKQNYKITVYVSMEGAFSVDMQSEQDAVTQKISGACTIL